MTKSASPFPLRRYRMVFLPPSISFKALVDNLLFSNCPCSSEPYAEALNFASINAPPGVSEFALSGLTPVPGRIVRAPRVGVSRKESKC